MNSNDRSEPLDLERGLPTTARGRRRTPCVALLENERCSVRTFPRGLYGGRLRVARREARTLWRGVFALNRLGVAGA